MGRFVLFSLPLLLLLMGLFGFSLEVLGLAPAGTGAALGSLPPRGLPPGAILGGWALEAAGLSALFLLVQGRAGSWWLDGLVAGWVAWIFRGPVLVVTVSAWGRAGRVAWWPLAARWLVLYSLGGLLLAALARRLELER